MLADVTHNHMLPGHTSLAYLTNLRALTLYRVRKPILNAYLLAGCLRVRGVKTVLCQAEGRREAGDAPSALLQPSGELKIKMERERGGSE
jgi:hypothetical protein